MDGQAKIMEMGSKSGENHRRQPHSRNPEQEETNLEWVCRKECDDKRVHCDDRGVHCDGGVMKSQIGRQEDWSYHLSRGKMLMIGF